MSHLSPEEVQRHVRVYLRVFAALAALTVITVSVSRLSLPLGLAVGAALLIALTKGTLVAAFFMHLASEKKVIFAVLFFALFFFFFLLLYPAWHHA